MLARNNTGGPPSKRMIAAALALKTAGCTPATAPFMLAQRPGPQDFVFEAKLITEMQWKCGKLVASESIWFTQNHVFYRKLYI